MALSDYLVTLADVVEVPQDRAELYDVFVAGAPYTSGNKKSSSSSVCINNLGMSDTSFQKIIRQPPFAWSLEYIGSSDSVSAKVKLAGESVVAYPSRDTGRLYLSQKTHTNGAGKITKDETDTTCLFRHLRNAIAHGGIYSRREGNVLLIDRADGLKGAVTAYCFISVIDMVALKDKLLNWVDANQSDMGPESQP